MSCAQMMPFPREKKEEQYLERCAQNFCNQFESDGGCGFNLYASPLSTREHEKVTVQLRSMLTESNLILLFN